MILLEQRSADARELDLAVDRYKRRVAMGGWHEEVWSSLYQIARLKQMQGVDWPTVLTGLAIGLVQSAIPVARRARHSPGNEQSCPVDERKGDWGSNDTA